MITIAASDSRLISSHNYDLTFFLEQAQIFIKIATFHRAKSHPIQRRKYNKVDKVACPVAEIVNGPDVIDMLWIK